MHAEAAVQASAGETDEGAKFGGGPLRGWSGAIAADGIWGAFLEGSELDRRVRKLIYFRKGRQRREGEVGGLFWTHLGFGFRVDFPHCGR